MVGDYPDTDAQYAGTPAWGGEGGAAAAWGDAGGRGAGEWSEYVTGDGTPYYYNLGTHVTTWQVRRWLVRVCRMSRGLRCARRMMQGSRGVEPLRHDATAWCRVKHGAS